MFRELFVMKLVIILMIIMVTMTVMLDMQVPAIKITLMIDNAR